MRLTVLQQVVHIKKRISRLENICYTSDKGKKQSGGTRMLTIYKTKDGHVHEQEKMEENTWICLTAPTEEELLLAAKECQIDTEDLKASLDVEEASRIEITDSYTLILVDIPSKEIRNGNNAYTTIPLSIILKEDRILTVCVEDTLVLKPFSSGRAREFSTAKRTRFIYQILYSNTSVYLNYLRKIDKSREAIEARLHHGTKNSDLIELHELESDLVYFATSLRVNGVVLDKLSRYERIKHYPEDQELLSDVIIENQQAIEMANIYRDVLNGTRELFASVIDNTLNSVMKALTSITIIMAIPTIISGFYGMNVNPDGMPFAASRNGFLYVGLLTAIICIIAILILKKKDLF